MPPTVITAALIIAAAIGGPPSAAPRLEHPKPNEPSIRPTVTSLGEPSPCSVVVDSNPGLELFQSGVACIDLSTSTAARFAKSHDLSLGFPDGNAVISCIEFGWACTGGPLGVELELHLDTDGGGPRPDGGDLVLLSRRSVTLPTASTALVRVPLESPVILSADEDVVVILDIPESPDGIASFGGGRDETNDRTWFTAPDCGVTEWRRLDAASIPLDWVVRLHGNPTVEAVCSPCSFDCDGDGVDDLEEIRLGASDCDGDLIPDECGRFADCDADGVPDACQSDDCNGNGVPDLCEVKDGTASDCDGNGIPDACDILAGARDLDRDGVLDCCVDDQVACRPGPPDRLDDATWIRVRRDDRPPPLTDQSLCAIENGWLLVGGRSTDGKSLGQSWRSDSGAWTLLLDGPPPRTEAGMASLATGALMFGGRSFTETLGDCWRFRPDSGWTRLDVVGPEARSGHAMASWQGGVLLFGGRDAAGDLLDDLWWFDGSVWTRFDVADGPAARAGHAMCLDRRRGDVLLHGGIGTRRPLADTWSFDGTAWTLRASGDGPGGVSIGLASLPESSAMIGVKDGGVWLFRDDAWHPWSIRGDDRGRGPAVGAQVASQPFRNAARIVGGEYDAAGVHEVVLSAARYPLRDCDGDFLEDHDEVAADPALDCDLDGRLDACEAPIGCAEATLDDPCLLQPVYGAAAATVDTNLGWNLQDVPAVHSIWIRRFQVDPRCPAFDSIWIWWEPLSFQERSARIVVFSDPDGDGRPYDAQPLRQREIPLIAGTSGWRRYRIPPVSPGPVGGSFFVAVEIFQATRGGDSPMSVVRRDRLVGESAWVAASSRPFELADLDRSADVWPLVPLSTTTGSDAWFMIAAGCGRPEDLDGDFVPDECEPCPEDVIGQFARVDAFDLEQVLLAWGSDDPRLDFDGDGLVDGVDLAAVLLAWGSCGG